MNIGWYSVAVFPGPSCNPSFPVPAQVVTVPSRATARILLLPVSATSSVPFEVIATAVGEANCATLPTPSANPGLPPASVWTIPPEIVRMR